MTHDSIRTCSHTQENMTSIAWPFDVCLLNFFIWKQCTRVKSKLNHDIHQPAVGIFPAVWLSLAKGSYLPIREACCTAAPNFCSMKSRFQLWPGRPVAFHVPSLLPVHGLKGWNIQQTSIGKGLAPASSKQNSPSQLYVSEGLRKEGAGGAWFSACLCVSFNSFHNSSNMKVYIFGSEQHCLEEHTGFIYYAQHKHF